ncbi:hypothetical protein FACS1894110_22480 [Spirochaetia bacterium]|nr:hypothetical protein FACS1894110_22480 [Spirochaetia bacterium]
METKLTLKLDQMVINSAKQYAENNHKSLSKLVEDYFKNLVYDYTPPPKYPPLIERLSGVISEKELKNLAKNDERARYILREDI